MVAVLRLNASGAVRDTLGGLPALAPGVFPTPAAGIAAAKPPPGFHGLQGCTPAPLTGGSDLAAPAPPVAEAAAPGAAPRPRLSPAAAALAA